MLPKKHRLTKRQDFKRVLSKGNSFFVEEFCIKFLNKKTPNKNIPTRIGIIVPKKFTKTIVLRNKIKRQVRNIFLRIISRIKENYDIIFLANSKFINLEFKDKEKKITKALKKTNLIKKQDNGKTL